MNRRQFVSRVSLGAAAACTPSPTHHSPPPPSGQVNVRFVGMMRFIERAGSLVPGRHARTSIHHMTHTPFLMARAGSPIAKALKFAPVPGVIPAAFDTRLIGTRPEDFVFRTLNNTSLDIVSGTRGGRHQRGHADGADEPHRAGQARPRATSRSGPRPPSPCAAAGSRTPPDIPMPARCGRSAIYTQRLTDAVNYTSEAGASTTIRLTSARDAQTHVIPDGQRDDLWIFSARPSKRGQQPDRIEHSDLLFDYLVDAKPVVAECPNATGRTVPPTEVPFVGPTSASIGIVASATMAPPDSWLCWMALRSARAR